MEKIFKDAKVNQLFEFLNLLLRILIVEIDTFSHHVTYVPLLFFKIATKAC
jgi:hypothetical protein